MRERCRRRHDARTVTVEAGRQVVDEMRAGLHDGADGFGRRDMHGARAAAGDAGGDRDEGEDPRGQRWTTGQVNVRVMPGAPCTFARTSLPSSSTLRASARTMTS